METQCPNCSKRMDVPDNLWGKSIFCTSCGTRIQAAGLKTADGAASAQAGGEATKKCPYCAETILKAARKCRYCKQDLPEGVDAEAVRDRLRIKDRKAADQGLAAASLPQPGKTYGRFRTVTKVMAAITAACLLIIVAAGVIHFNDQDDQIALIVMGVMFGLIFGIILLVVFIADLLVPASDKRTTPAQGLKAFLASLRLGRFSYGYFCLLDGDKDGLTRSRQPIDQVKVYGGDYAFSDSAGFKQYWKGICRPSDGQNRRMVVSHIRQEKVQGDYALVSARVRIESYPTWVVWTVLLSLLLVLILIAVMTKRQELTVTKLMRRVGGQWYVVNGELSSAEDNAWEVASSLA